MEYIDGFADSSQVFKGVLVIICILSGGGVLSFLINIFPFSENILKTHSIEFELTIIYKNLR